MPRYFIINKPYLVLSQFTSQQGKKTLGDFFAVPSNVYPVGRLDYDSEGLLILTDDTSLNHRLLTPSHQHQRAYWVQVEGAINQEALQQLQAGVTISIDGKQHRTQPCKAYLFLQAPEVPDREPPIRYRQQIPTNWISITLTEGKNRQVRRMTAAVGYPTLRLIRNSIEKLNLNGLLTGQMKELNRQEIYAALFG